MVTAFLWTSSLFDLAVLFVLVSMAEAFAVLVPFGQYHPVEIVVILSVGCWTVEL